MSLLQGEVFAPAQLGMALGLVYREVGVAMFAALGFVVAILPLLIITFILFAMYRRLKNIPGDSRVKLTNEVLSGIRIIKYYSWERPFFAKIDALRTTELSYLLKMNLVLVLIVMLITSIPFVLPIVIFYTYTNINNKQLDVGKAFTTLALLGLVSGPMTMIPAFIQRYFQARISMTRIYEFLSCDELEQYITFDSIATSEQSGCVISLRDASLGWINEPTAGATSGENAKDATKYESLPADASTVGIELTEKLEGAAVCEELINRSANTLINVNLSVQEGELVAIIGGVGKL